jgi:hypothetical protein
MQDLEQNSVSWRQAKDHVCCSLEIQGKNQDQRLIITLKNSMRQYGPALDEEIESLII